MNDSVRAVVRFEGVLPTDRFSRILLPDSTPVQQAVKLVCECKNRQALTQEVTQRLTAQTTAKTVGDLRKLTDFDWLRLHLPVMFKVLLKHLVRLSVSPPVGSSAAAVAPEQTHLHGLLIDPQAFAESALGKVLLQQDPNLFRNAGIVPRPVSAEKPNKSELLNNEPFVQALAIDFNYGQPFDFTLYQKPLKQLQELGYNKQEALEAILVSGSTGHVPALEVLFCSQEVRQKRRLKAVQRFNRNLGSTCRQQSFLDESPSEQGSADPQQALAKALQKNLVISGGSSRPPEAAVADPVSPQSGSGGGGGGGGGDSQMVQKMYQELQQLRRRLHKSGGGGLANDDEKRVDMAEHDLRKHSYREFLRGLVAGDAVTAQEQEQLKMQKDRLFITDDEHVQILQELNLTQAEFDAMKQSGKFDLDCVVCMDNPKSHVIFNCAHLCLCDECADEYKKKPKAQCPMCEKKVVKVVKIYL